MKIKKKIPKIIIDGKIYIPEEYIDIDILKKYYEHNIKISNIMNYNRTDNNNEYKIIKLYDYVEINNKGYYTVPNGNLKRVSKLLNLDFNDIINKRSYKKFKHNIKFTGELYTGKKVKGINTIDQVSVIESWLKKKFGILKCAPRSGKSVMGINISITLGLKTLIIAHQDDLLKNFLKVIYGDKKKGIKPLTNIPILEKKLGKKIAGIVNKTSDFKKYDIALITYQSYIHKKADIKIKKYINNEFGLLIVDECHMMPATAYARFMNKLNMGHKLGLTATPNRKDGLSFILRDVIGPITAKSVGSSMLPKINLFESNIGKSKRINHWHWVMKFLAEDEERNKQIVKQAFKDLRSGHPCIIIPVDWISHAERLKKIIDLQLMFNNKRKGENWSKGTCQIFKGQSDRDKILTDVDNGKIKILIGIRKILRQGIDLLKPTMLYSIIPTSNPAMFYQLVNRVCTPHKDKIQPEIRIWIDHVKPSFYCFKAIARKEICMYTNKNKKEKRYLLDDETEKRIKQILDMKDYNNNTIATVNRKRW